MANEVKNVVQNFENKFADVKKAGIICGAILALLGILTFLHPVATSVLFLWIIVIGLIINGASKLVLFFKLPKDQRSGWSLALAILWIVAALFLIADICKAPIDTTISLELFVGIIIGFNCIFSGVSSFCMSSEIKAAGGNSAFVIISGILESLCGIVVLSSPVFGVIAFTFVFGIYLTVMGIAMIVRCVSF